MSIKFNIFCVRSEPLAAVQGVPLRFVDSVNHGIQTVDGDLACRLSFILSFIPLFTAFCHFDHIPG